MKETTSSIFTPSGHSLFEVQITGYRPANNNDDNSERFETVYVVSTNPMTSYQVLMAVVRHRNIILNSRSVQGKEGNQFARATYTVRNDVYPNGQEYEIKVNKRAPHDWGEYGGTQLMYLSDGPLPF